VCTSELERDASSSVLAGRSTRAGQVLSEVPGKEIPKPSMSGVGRGAVIFTF
jgi:hypothetical protein